MRIIRHNFAVIAIRRSTRGSPSGRIPTRGVCDRAVKPAIISTRSEVNAVGMLPCEIPRPRISTLPGPRRERRARPLHCGRVNARRLLPHTAAPTSRTSNYNGSMRTPGTQTCDTVARLGSVQRVAKCSRQASLCMHHLSCKSHENCHDSSRNVRTRCDCGSTTGTVYRLKHEIIAYLPMYEAPTIRDEIDGYYTIVEG